MDFTDLVDLAAERVGGSALAASDEFFAEKENLLKPGRGVFIAEKYTDRGKWMDGWESRRKRGPGNDWCIVKLGLPGRIHGFDIDTNYFLGNYPEYASVEALATDPDASVLELTEPAVQWTEVLPMRRLEGGSRNLFAIDSDRRWTHVRLNIFPDGGVARFRVHGAVRPNWENLLAAGGDLDLAAIEHGGVAVLASDMFFSHMNNLIMPGRAPNMGDGWETRRRRGPGNDWIVIRLGAPGEVRKVEIDTNHFKGNYPDSCSLDGCFVRGDPPAEYLASLAVEWHELLPHTKLEADHRHHFDSELRRPGVLTHVRLNVFPDGGVSRLRLYGTPRRDA
ncbi:MAG: allantoicase [Candidatus Sericytochromatia bacterium]|nr:allantoicase [Candidatus Tanganyikabacteria bacterium]